MKRIAKLPGVLVVTSSIIALSICPGAARADDTSPARQLFVEARKLTQDGKYAEACPKLEQSLRLEAGIGTQFNLADCWEHIGRTASAHALFLGAAASAHAAGQNEREQVLRERAAALEPRLTRLVIEAPSATPQLSIKRNELPLEADQLGKAVPVDQGKYTITARAPGKKTWTKVVDVDGSAPVVTIEVPELEAVAAAPPAAAAPPEAPAAPEATRKAAPPPPAAGEKDRRPGPNYGAIAVAGLGAAGIVVGSVMGLKYKSANDDAKQICPSGQGCSIKEIQDHDRLVDKARTDRTWSYVGFGAGTALLLGGGALWYLQRPESTERAAWHALPLVGADGSLGAVLDGRF